MRTKLPYVAAILGILFMYPLVYQSFHKALVHNGCVSHHQDNHRPAQAAVSWHWLDANECGQNCPVCKYEISFYEETHHVSTDYILIPLAEYKAKRKQAKECCPLASFFLSRAPPQSIA